MTDQLTAAAKQKKAANVNSFIYFSHFINQ